MPGAAESWTVSDDGLVYTFKLRVAGKWSNGDAVVAEDFVAGFRRLVDPATASQYAQLVGVFVNANDIIAAKKPPDTLGVAAPDAGLAAAEYRQAVKATGAEYVFLSRYHPRDTLRTVAWQAGTRALTEHAKPVHVCVAIADGPALDGIPLQPAPTATAAVRWPQAVTTKVTMSTATDAMRSSSVLP